MSKQQIGLSECDITFDYKNITFLMSFSNDRYIYPT